MTVRGEIKGFISWNGRYYGYNQLKCGGLWDIIMLRVEVKELWMH